MSDTEVNVKRPEIESTAACGIFRASTDLPRLIKRFQRVDVGLGESTIPGRVVPLEITEISAGVECAIQLLFDSPMKVYASQEFSMKFPRDGSIVGNGVIHLGSSPRFNSGNMDRLASVTKALAEKRYKDAIVSIVELYSPAGIGKSFLHLITGIPIEDIGGIVEGEDSLHIIKLNRDELVMAVNDKVQLYEKVIRALKEHHISNPHMSGPTMDEISSALNPTPSVDILKSVLDELLEDEKVHAEDGHYRMHDFTPSTDDIHHGLSGEALKLIVSAGIAPPSTTEAGHILKQPEKRVRGILQHLATNNFLERVDKNIFMDTSIFEKAKKEALDAIRENGELHVAEFREMIDSSRKVAIAILERLDRKGLTVREGDFHIAGPKFPVDD